MDLPAMHLYQFGPFCLDTAERLLICNGRPVSLTPKAFETLLALVENSGHIIEKDELIKRVWPDSFVEEATLAQNVFTLRRALGEAQGEHQYIETIPKRGYRFVAIVVEVPGESVALVLREHSRSEVIIEEDEPVYEPGKPLGLRSAIRQSNTLRITSVVAAVAVISAVVYGLLRFTGPGQPSSQPVALFSTVRVSRLSSNGKSIYAAISPDGKYVAHVIDDAGRQSVWVRQVAVDSNALVVGPAEVTYEGLIFSRDGNWIYYIKDSGLYQVAALGGASRKLLTDVDWGLTLSPDGKQLAFVRDDVGHGESQLVLFGADGGETKLAARRLPDYFKLAAWSPDGKTIACSVGIRIGGKYTTVTAVDSESGAERALSSKQWLSVGGLAWLSEGNGILMAARDQESTPTQIWFVPYPGGEARQITHSLDEYSGISLTADTNTLVTVKRERLSNIWIAPQENPTLARQITSGASKDINPSWTPDRKIVYQSEASGSVDIWIMDADGSNKKQLTVNTGTNFVPSVSPDGRYIVFASRRTGVLSIWRMDIDGGNPKQITHGTSDSTPQCSRDAKWVVFTGWGSGRPTLWRVSIEGGVPVQLTHKLSRHPDISPDGKLIACYYWDENESSPFSLAVIPFLGGEPMNLFDLPPTVPLPVVVRWNPDGRALTYIDDRGGVSNLWSRPLNGGKPKQITDFKGDRIFSFALSPDGKHLAYSRGVATSDVVLISNTQ